MVNGKICVILRDLFGSDVGVGVTNPRDTSHTLMAPEQPAVTNAIPKRQIEFAAGRAAARMALADINMPPQAIPQAADRSPVWPAGIMGSISHCANLCVAVACPMSVWRAVGVDIENTAPLEKEAWSIILTSREQRALVQLPFWRRAQQVKVLFSIKEAVYKAQYPLTHQLCDFQALDVTLDGDRFAARFNQQLGSFQTGFVATGRYVQTDRWVISACTLKDR
ncbi:4'-phosphopantetheinyl transferase [Thalassobius sp. Cn5-15]|uniref:4'-phosphopantetheinyl transferase family protein n=1 Tax=Thalassobius sp. Cn5-15 TaxID=2917763 RepID=UPI001EF295D2|nr:4'-phosphopantetheinyl transferase superfamily protein [Thalassobius sp. Cn5-15]MCG7494058.1 4'-phosphopantetheinyl transferase superfamily protein [Thalassobius sp. Cn5-15]